LEDHADSAALRRGVSSCAVYDLATDRYDAFIRFFKPGYESKGGGLAAAAGTQQGEDLTFRDAQI
jgi:hypothetical protein